MWLPLYHNAKKVKENSMESHTYDVVVRIFFYCGWSKNLDKYDKTGENFGMQNFGITDAKSFFLEVLPGF